MKPDDKRKLNPAAPKGVAMISALGVLVILGLLASVFSAHMRLQSAYSARDAQEFKAHYLAVAGIQDAIARIEADPQGIDSYADSWWTGDTPEMTPLGEGGYTLTVTDESALINLATASPQTLSALLGGDKEATAAVVKFRASTTPFVVEDLSAADIPADALSRVTSLATTLGNGKVNVNTASPDVIAALPGMDTDAAQLLIGYRRGPDAVDGTSDDHIFARLEDIKKVPGLASVRTAPAVPLIKAESNIFRVESVGSIYKNEMLVANKKITVVVRRDDNQNVSIISWESS
jgi:DNA uptake protein ComE-like DNA-binding protein